MSVQLSHEDFTRTVQILAGLDDFRTVTGRVRLVTAALEGSPRSQDLLGQMDLDGPPRSVAVEVVRRLATFGRVTPTQEALGILLNELLTYKGEADPDAAFLRGLFEIYALDRPVAAAPGLDEWRGGESNASVLEKLIGENTLRPIAMLEQALLAAESVVHISGTQGMGTGFVAGQGLIMTNHHVLRSKSQALDAIFTFNYQLDIHGQPRATRFAQPVPDGLFYTNPDLDITLVELADIPETIQPLALKPRRVAKESRVTIIQHPAGSWKKISLQNNFVAYADTKVVQYTTSTLPGSSGSPVFDDDFHVVAIHHAGGDLPEPTTLRRYLRNEGISMMAVLADLAANAPDIHARLNKV